MVRIENYIIMCWRAHANSHRLIVLSILLYMALIIFIMILCSLLILITYADGTKSSIKDAGEASGEVHASLSISDSNQCTMMNALVDQMKDSCNFKWSEEVYVNVASAYMTGFNSKAGDSEKKDDFVAFCNLGSLWE